MKYTIDRAIWVHGGDRHIPLLGHPRLLNEINNQCCLGQVCEQEGVSREVMLDENTPHKIRNSLPEGHWLIDAGDNGDNSRVAQAMMEVNDAAETTREYKEAELIKLAASEGHELVFVGEYPAGVK